MERWVWTFWVIFTGGSSCWFHSPWDEPVRGGVCCWPAWTAGITHWSSARFLHTSVTDVVSQRVSVCVFSGSRTRRRLTRSPVGSGWRDGHSGLHREHGSGKSVSVLQRHRYSSLILTCCFHVFWAVSSGFILLLASQCASASSLCSVRSLTWWVQIQSAMTSQAGSVRSRTTRLSLTPVPSCRTPQCKRLQMITDFCTAVDDL